MVKVYTQPMTAAPSIEKHPVIENVHRARKLIKIFFSIVVNLNFEYFTTESVLLTEEQFCVLYNLAIKPPFRR